MRFNFNLVNSVLLVTICLSTCFAYEYEDEINKLSVSMADKIVKNGKRKIAVVDFTDLNGNVTELGRFIAEEFSVALAGTGNDFQIVDRTHLKSIIKENKLAETGLIEPSTARELGKIAGVEALVTGTFTLFGDSVRLSVKILDTSTAVVIDAKRGNIAKTKYIEELAGKGIATPNPKHTTPLPLEIKAEKEIEAQGFVYALQQAKRSGSKITCSLLITSRDQDNKLSVYREYYEHKSRIIDELGNEYIAKTIQLGDKVTDSGYVDNLFVSGIPTKAILTFEGVDQNSKMIRLLEMTCAKNDKEAFRSQIRNINLSQ